MTLTKQIDENVEKLIFKDYFNALQTDEEKNKIRDAMFPKYMSYTSFYRKVRDNAFTPLELEKLEEITNLKFD